MKTKADTRENKTIDAISTAKVTSTLTKSPVEEGTSNDSSKGEIIFFEKNEDAIGFTKDKKDPKELSTAAPKVRGKKYGKALLVENSNEPVNEIISEPSIHRTSELIKTADINIEKTKPDRVKKELVAEKSTKEPSTTIDIIEQKSTEKPTLKSDFSVSEENVSEKNIVMENESISYNKFNRDFTTEEGNMKTVSKTLFSDEDDFESFDDKTITATRYTKKVKSSGPNPANYDDTAVFNVKKQLSKSSSLKIPKISQRKRLFW